MATKREKSALPRAAANPGNATAAVSTTAAAFRKKLFFMSGLLEFVSEVDTDQICVGLVRAVEVVSADSLRAALLEVKDELGRVDDPRTVVIAHAERESLAIRIGQQRPDIPGRLR